MIRTLVIAGSFLMSMLAMAAPAADTPDGRLNIAGRLFELPAYRLIATRQIYEALNSLPDDQRKRARAALSDPAFMTSLRGVISRSMAQTFSTVELEHLTRFLRADEARSMLDKAQGFQFVLTKEMMAAALSDPALIRILIGE